MSKTLRIDEGLCKMVHEYVKRHNEIFDIELTERQVVEACIKKAMIEKIETLEGIILQRKLKEMS